jgi:hypothetical protein
MNMRALRSLKASVKRSATSRSTSAYRSTAAMATVTASSQDQTGSGKFNWFSLPLAGLIAGIDHQLACCDFTRSYL